MTDETPIATLKEDGSVEVVAPVTPALLNGNGFGKHIDEWSSQVSGLNALMSAGWKDGKLIAANTSSFPEGYRSPRLTVPGDYYTRVSWSSEYYEQEPLVNALIHRDIEQSMTAQELQMPEENIEERKAVDKWMNELNRDLGLFGGLQEFNRSLMLSLILTSYAFTIPNWGPMMSKKGKIYEFPKTLTNLNPMSIVPYIDPFSGQRKYYYILSAQQAEAIQKRRKNGISELIPDARKRLVTDLTVVKQSLRDNLSYSWPTIRSEFAIELPTEGVYITNLRLANQSQRWPIPTLVPIFSAIAMKRKLALADWTVADGMVNLLMVWTFPPGASPSASRSIVQKFMEGGRVQSHAVPEGVKVQVVTPPTDMLNSSEKFWQPVSEIYMHFGFPLNSKSRGAGDMDSGAGDLSANRTRLGYWRDVIEDHNNFWFSEIAERNDWDFDLYSTFQTRDLDDDANFRTFATGLFDRGLLSVESLHDLAGTSTERELSRRKREKKDGLDEIFSIRPSFSQTAGPAIGGRPPAGAEKPKSDTKPSGTGIDTQKQQSRSARGRPSVKAQ
jgi:hypothetical protein